MPQFNSQSSHIDYRRHNALLKALQDEDMAFFRQAHIKQHELEYALHTACSANMALPVIDNLVKSGARNFVDALVNGAMEQNHYQLCYDILVKYGKQYDIQILRDSGLNIRKHMVAWAASGHEQFFCLYKLVVEMLPNHSQYIFKSDKYYDAHHHKRWWTVYNSILYHILASRLGHGFNNSVDEKNHDALWLEAIAVIAARKFPVFHDYLILIERYNLTHLFKGRMNSSLPGWHEEFRGIAHSPVLFNHDLRHDIDYDVRKWELFLELKFSLGIPDKIGSVIYDGFQGSNNKNHKIGVRQMLTDEQYLFLKKFDLENRYWIVNFFKKYFNYERAQLHERLKESLLAEHDNNDHGLDESCVVKI